ncbi:MAG TPA: lysophospholipid acyltransferase family protein [Dongiaceae bacterium]|jgi:1-acyl-sn-glycerol-3-phosphate acyltransferase
MRGKLRALFFLLLVRPLVLLMLGVNARHRMRLPAEGSAIIAANHNSHLDTLVLMTLFPQAMLPRLRPVAAADYFLRNRLFAWFAREIIGILPLSRCVKPGDPDPLAACDAALAEGDILIMFPEGTRGEPERIGAFKSGIAHLTRRHPDAPVVPVFLHGLGKALPRGAYLLVPFFVDVFVGEPLRWSGDKQGFMAELDRRIQALAAEGSFPPWE